MTDGGVDDNHDETMMLGWNENLIGMVEMPMMKLAGRQRRATMRWWML